MKYRTKGTGTLVKIGGTWYGRIMRKGKVQVVKLSTNQREAEVLWKEWLINNPTAPKYDTVKHELDTAWAKAVENYKIRASSKALFISFQRYFKRFRAWCAERGKTCLEDITTADIVDYIDETTAEQSKCVKRNHLYMIRDLWTCSMPDVPNPTRHIKLKVDTKSIPREPLTDEEIDKVLETASKYKYFPREMHGLIMVGLYTGLRRTDCVHLKVENIRDGVIALDPVKTIRKGVTVRIPLHPVLKAELDSLGVTTGYFFPNLVKMADKNVGTILTWHIGRIFGACVTMTTTQEGRKRKVPVKGFHALRATFITRLAQKGVSLPIMETLAGHLNPQMTMHYTHPDEEVKKAAIDVLSFGKEVDDRIFLHPDVKKLMDEFEKQKQEFLAKIEEKINELTKGEAKTPPRDGIQALLTRVDGVTLTRLPPAFQTPV